MQIHTCRKVYEEVKWMFDTEGTDVIAVAAIACALLAEWQDFNKQYEERHGISTEHFDATSWLTDPVQYSEVLKLIITSSQILQIIRPPNFTYADSRSFLKRVTGYRLDFLGTPSGFPHFHDSFMEAVNNYKISKEGMHTCL